MILALTVKNGQVDNEVFDILKKLLKKKYIYKVEQFVQFALEELSYPETVIRSSIYCLIQRNWIVPGSRLTYEDVLTNETRKRIFNFIFHNPGCILKEIESKFNLGSHAMRWHIGMLKQFGYIRTRKIQRFVALYPIELNPAFEEAVFLLRRKPVQKIITHLEEQGEMSQTKLKNILKLHHSTIQYHIRPLIEVGIIADQAASHMTKYSLNQNRLDQIQTALYELYKQHNEG